MSAIIYCITNTLNGKSYIGLTTQSLTARWEQHRRFSRKGSSTHFHNAIRKYGSDAFTCVILEETTVALMNERERYWIAEQSPAYNMTIGGEGCVGVRRSPETRQRMSRAQKGRPRSPEYRAKISASLTGEKNPRYGKTGDQHPLYGKQHSEETRHKMQASHLKCIWEVTTPTGDIVRVTNLKQYCREHGISQPNLITHGHTKGYRARKLS